MRLAVDRFTEGVDMHLGDPAAAQTVLSKFD